MKTICLFFLVFTMQVYGESSKELERLNFFPRAKSFAAIYHVYERQELTTPREVAGADSVVNTTNALNAVYGHRFKSKYFAGVSAHYEKTSENTLSYGIPTNRDFSGSGFNDPKFFVMGRLREQNGEKGLIDFYLSHTHSFAHREVGSHHSGYRSQGRNITQARLTHGMHEDKWEFKTSLELGHQGQGDEFNGIEDRNFTTKPFSTAEFNFKFQYQLRSDLFINSGIGLFAIETQVISSGEDTRDIQIESGSVYHLGLKKVLSNTTMIEFQLRYLRNEYYVKDTGFNLNGDSRTLQTRIGLIRAF